RDPAFVPSHRGERGKARAYGCTYHLACIVDPVSQAHGVAGQCSEVDHSGCFRPQKSVKRDVAFQLRMAGHLTPMIHCTGVVARNAADPAEVSEVTRGAVAVPEQSSILDQIALRGGIEGPAGAG